MFLRDVMESTAEYVSANDYALDALQRMRDAGGRCAFVLDRDDVVGLVYSSDLEDHSANLLCTSDVREYMRRQDLIQVTGDTEPEEAERLLKNNKSACLAVIDQDRPVGIVTQHTLDAVIRDKTRNRLANREAIGAR